MSDGVIEAVMAANEELYAAFESGDLDRMQALWVEGLWGAMAKCVHPGGVFISGIDPILRSWALIMANSEDIQFIVTDVEVNVKDDSAVVTCTEIILSPGGDEEPFVSNHAMATNGFVEIDGRWRMWLHHASPVMGPSGGAQ